jgi:hypothetical protein
VSVNAELDSIQNAAKVEAILDEKIKNILTDLNII